MGGDFPGPASGRRGTRRLSVKLRLAALFCLLAGLLFMVDRNLRPLIQSYGETAAKWVATRAVNDGVTKALAEAGMSYDQLITRKKTKRAPSPPLRRIR